MPRKPRRPNRGPQPVKQPTHIGRLNCGHLTECWPTDHAVDCFVCRTKQYIDGYPSPADDELKRQLHEQTYSVLCPGGRSVNASNIRRTA